MKAICIDNTGAPELIEGDVYTASQCPVYEDSYDIDGFKYDPREPDRLISYKKRRFLPTSDIEEGILEQVKIEA